MKKAFLAAAALLVLLSVPASAADVDMSYSGVIDSYTGLPAGQFAVPEGVERVQLSSSSYYDFTARRFIYTFSSGMEVSSTAANGMVTTGPVSVTLSAGAVGRLYRDGEALEETDYSALQTPGSYVLSVNTNAGVTAEPLQFTIVGDVTGALEQYTLPAGFVFTDARRDGTAIEFDAGQAALTEEGKYELTYVCEGTGVSYALNTEIDHTPPVLALSGVADGVAKGPVDISDLEPGTTIRIELDGRDVGYATELTQSGSYHLWLRDKAGNTAEYQFRIQVYMNTSAFFAVILAAAVILGLIIFIVYSRNKLRVR